MNAASQHAQPTFEEVYPKAPFAELIRLTMAVGAGLVKLRARLTGPTPKADITQSTAR